MGVRIGNSEVVNAADIVGADVYGRSGEKLGSIRAVYLDERSGQAEFVCLACGGVLGLGETFYPTPWSALRFDPTAAVYRSNLDRKSLDAGPGFGQDASGRDWVEQTRTYHADLTADSSARHFTHGTSAATADMAVAGAVIREDGDTDTPHARPVDAPPEGEKLDHLAEKVDQAEDRQEALLDEGIEESFPASDPVSVKRIT